MDWDEPKSKAGAVMAAGENLEALSVADLETRLTAFQAEIDRLKAEIARRKAHSSAAEGLFKR